MKLLLAVMIAMSLCACALDQDAFRDDRFFSTKSVFEKHEKYSGGSAQ